MSKMYISNCQMLSKVNLLTCKKRCSWHQIYQATLVLAYTTYLDAVFCIESTSVLPGRSTYGYGLYTQRSREWGRRLGMGGRREGGGGRREEGVI